MIIFKLQLIKYKNYSNIIALNSNKEIFIILYVTITTLREPKQTSGGPWDPCHDDTICYSMCLDTEYMWISILLQPQPTMVPPARSSHHFLRSTIKLQIKQLNGTEALRRSLLTSFIHSCCCSCKPVTLEQTGSQFQSTSPDQTNQVTHEQPAEMSICA